MPKPKPPLGRPRDSQIDHAISRATRELLAERGYAGLTVDAVAARAGIGKAAIYRRFATKQEMIFAASVHDMAEQAPPDTGSLHDDLAAVCETIAEQLGSAPPDVLHGLLADIHADTALGKRFSETFLQRERFVLRAVLDRAVMRGELSEPPDIGMAHALLLGPIFYWLLILTGERERVPELTRTVARTVTAALLSDPIRARGSSS